MGFPPFRGAVRQIILASTAIYVVILLLLSFNPELGKASVRLGELDPGMVRQGAIWQFVTYGFVYIDPLDFVLSLLGVYFLGASVEDSIGSARFYSLYFFSLIASGLAGFALSSTGVVAQGAAIGSGAAANAILMVFYLLFRNAPIMLFPLPIQIPVKWIVLFTAGIETAYLLLNHFALLFCVLLLGLGAGWAWFNIFARRPVMAKAAKAGISERVYGVRNAYYRWKRRRAARKFQVYMRKHDRTVYFDEYGNYKPPEDKREEGGRGPWVN